MLLGHRLAGTARAPMFASQPSTSVTVIRAAPRTRVAKPGLSATSESKSEQTVTVKAPQTPKTGDFIAGPYGLGRVSLDAAGEGSCVEGTKPYLPESCSMLLIPHCTSSQTLLKMCWKSLHCGICCSPGEDLNQNGQGATWLAAGGITLLDHTNPAADRASVAPAFTEQQGQSVCPRQQLWRRLW
jgi:hypothetical protein